MRITADMHPAHTLPALPTSLRLPHALARLALRLRLWRAERRTLAEMARLDRATLRDIGMAPHDVREHFRAERERLLLREAGWPAKR